VTVASGIATLNTIGVHGLTSAHATLGATASCITTNTAYVETAAVMDGLSYVEILSVPTTTTLTFATAQGDSGPTTETSGTTANFWTALYASQADGIPDSWKTTKALDTAIDYTGVLADVSLYSHVDNWVNDVAGDTIDAADYPVGTGDPVVDLNATYNGIINVAIAVAPTVTDPDADARRAGITVTGSLTISINAGGGGATVKGGV